MLCGCVPIVSDVASMPDLVNDSGYILKNKDLTELEQLVDDAIKETKPELALKARANIAERYTEERRHRELLQVLSITQKSTL
jgi:glycosyltransferase involved in cell wall biosynthesis